MVPSPFGVLTLSFFFITSLSIRLNHFLGGLDFTLEITFLILEFFSDRSSLVEREKQLVNESLLKDPMCMNMCVGGEGGFISVDG
jgi:hypothetical protein